MNQVEATTVLQQRYKMFLPPEAAAGRTSDHDLEEVIRFSRKCQAKIAFRLQRHQEREHAA
jgi:hypothetical protein